MDKVEEISFEEDTQDLQHRLRGLSSRRAKQYGYTTTIHSHRSSINFIWQFDFEVQQFLFFSIKDLCS
jgi:hypothetical protein